MEFGPKYFATLEQLGVGLGLNPIDAHATYFEDDHRDFDYVELTLPSTRLRGRPSYADLAALYPERAAMPLKSEPEIVSDERVVLHSTNLNPAYPSPSSDDDLRIVSEALARSRSPWVTEDLGVWFMGERHLYPYFMQFPFTEDTLSVTIDNVLQLQKALGVPFNAEFPPMGELIGDLHPFQFFDALAHESGCGFCLDLGHLLSFQMERGVDATVEIDRLPWDSVTELHLAGGTSVESGERVHYVDSHANNGILPGVWALLDAALQRSPNLKAITYEVFGAKDSKKVRDQLGEIAMRPTVAAWRTQTTLGRSPRSQAGIDHGVDIKPPSETTRERVRRDLVKLYDEQYLFPGPEPEVGSSAAFRRVVHDEQLRSIGSHVAAKYPGTSRVLMAIEHWTADELFRELLLRLDDGPGDNDAKILLLYAELIDQLNSPAGILARECLELEQWMSRVSLENVTGSFETQSDLIEILKRVVTQPEALTNPEFRVPSVVTHVGNAKFTKRLVDLVDVAGMKWCENRGDDGLSTPCCTGE